MSRILITGASGCVGQYISSWLLQHSDAELLLWLRDPEKLKAVSAEHPRIRLLVGDLRDTDRFAHELATVHRVIHTATAWGDPERAEQVNVVAVKRMLELLDPGVVEQIIYFSTASILIDISSRCLKPLPMERSTSRQKHGVFRISRCILSLHGSSRCSQPSSSGTTDGSSPFLRAISPRDLGEASRWLWLACWLRADASFHFIHAEDIARICGQFAITPHAANQEPGQGALRRIVMGQPALCVDDAVATLCRWRGVWRTPGIPLIPWLIETLIRVLPIDVTAWDRFSIRQRHFVHEPASAPERFGETSHAPDLETVLGDSGLPRREGLRSRRKVTALT